MKVLAFKKLPNPDDGDDEPVQIVIPELPKVTITEVQSQPQLGPMFVVSKYGTRQLVFKQHTFNRHMSRDEVTYWRCSQFAVLRCRARIRTKNQLVTVLNGEHNHAVITKARKYGSLKSMKLEQAAAAAAEAVAHRQK